ncbi:hypothetical protein ACP70R_008209 [Stipagrostis hirtigluma subsp. patula]
MSTDTTITYPESVASCRSPTPATPARRPPPPPPPAAAPAVRRVAPVRRQLDFAGGDDLEDDDEFLCLVDDIERGYSEAKRRAPQCVCRRGVCAVERDEKRGRWMYVCSAVPKCKHIAFYEDIDVNPKSQPALNIQPKTSSHHVLNGSNNHMVDARTGINVSPQTAAATSPGYVSPQAAAATIPGYVSPQSARATAPVNVGPRGAGTTNVSPQGAHATTPVNVGPRGAGNTNVIPQGAHATTTVNVGPRRAGTTNVSPQGARSNGGWPICLCRAGKCSKLTENKIEYYVCHIRKGQGACSHKVPVNADAEEPPQNGNNSTRGDKHLECNTVKEADGKNLVHLGDNNANGSVNPAQIEDDEWAFDIVDNDIVPKVQPAPHDEVRQESPGMLHQSIPVVKTPERSPMPPNGTRSPITPGSGICYHCYEEGHWSKNCPKRACHQCGAVGHWKRDCPQL